MQDTLNLNAMTQIEGVSHSVLPNNLPTNHQKLDDMCYTRPPSRAEDIPMLHDHETSLRQPCEESLSRPQSPVSQILLEIQTPTPRMTFIQEATYRVDALNSRLDVYVKEKALAESRMNECNASYKLYKAQFALADQKIFEVNLETGSAKNALAIARRTAKSIRLVDIFTDGRADELGTSV